MQYRREIDGLRAIAVLPVILFHAGIDLFRGGFVGVDVFFVISGYLITGIIIGDLESDKGFSLYRFYERRARRILPALYLVMAVSTLFAWLLLIPDQLENFGQSLVATTLFANNILLAMTSDYWDITTELKPLVHTWSLSVEEQYYVLFPLFIAFLWKTARRPVIIATAAMLVLSLAVAEWGARSGNLGNFYLPFGRVWEIFAGSLCAYWHRHHAIAKNDAAAFAGLGMILVSVFAYSEATPFPSLYGVLPVLGTALLVLFATSDGMVGRLLGWSPFVWVGLLSYSAYLWHQPVFAFTRAFMKFRPEPVFLAALTPMIFLLAYLSWRYLETPFRNKARIGNTVLWGSAAAFSLIFVAVGFTFHKTHGLPNRLYADQLASTEDMYISYNTAVFARKIDQFEADKPVRLLVLGDSFGRDIANMVTETYRQDHIALIYRDDINACVSSAQASAQLDDLLRRSTAIFISGTIVPDDRCVADSIAWAKANGKTLLYFGMKNFGTNMNWIMRASPADRPNLTNRPDPEAMQIDRRLASTIPADHFVSLMAPIMVGDQVRFTDEKGRLLSADTRHLTKHGAIFLGAKVLDDPRIAGALHDGTGALAKH
jgi:peptidoglycan/LPS O-acetylase OafA/YrhL